MSVYVGICVGRCQSLHSDWSTTSTLNKPSVVCLKTLRHKVKSKVLAETWPRGCGFTPMSHSVPRSSKSCCESRRRLTGLTVTGAGQSEWRTEKHTFLWISFTYFWMITVSHILYCKERSSSFQLEKTPVKSGSLYKAEWASSLIFQYRLWYQFVQNYHTNITRNNFGIFKLFLSKYCYMAL